MSRVETTIMRHAPKLNKWTHITGNVLFGLSAGLATMEGNFPFFACALAGVMAARTLRAAEAVIKVQDDLIFRQREILVAQDEAISVLSPGHKTADAHTH
jgi:hypothetical protein